MRLIALPPSRRVWFFDLDNTLHDAQAHIFPSMNAQISQYLMRRFDIGEADAHAMRRGFWEKYGTTMNGLVRHHGTNPAEFLRATHQFPELADMVVHENAVRHALARLPGRKILYTNAPRHYVDEVVRTLGVARYFDAVYSIENTRYLGKPSVAGFRMLLRKHHLAAARCALVDDMLENLRTAKRLGMATVWVSQEKKSVPYVDLRISSVTQLPGLVFRYAH
jgi:putative hydrolase of the HAD superfamily